MPSSSSGSKGRQCKGCRSFHGHHPNFDPTPASKRKRAKRILRYPNKSRPCTKAGYLTISQLAEKLNVTYTKIYWHILDGKINVKKDETTRCFLFPDKPSTVDQIRLLFAGNTKQLYF